MHQWSRHSREVRETLHPTLQVFCDEALKYFDLTLIEGWRGKQRQDALLKRKLTKTPFPQSRHNRIPSEAVDMTPYGWWGVDRDSIVWPERDAPSFIKDLAIWYYFGGCMRMLATKLSINIRWGGDWNSNYVINDQKFDDLCHFELR